MSRELYAVNTDCPPAHVHAARRGLTNLIRRRRLLIALVWRDVTDRYRGSMFGLLWSFLTPLLLMIVYTFVFSGIFGAAWPGLEGRPTAFALMLFCGLLPFTMVSEVATKSCAAVLQSPSYVKRVTFPIEILPVIPVGSALVHLMVGLVVLGLAALAVMGRLPVTVLCIPLLLVPFVFVSLGLACFLSVLGVFFRDVGHVVNVALTMLLFLSPILYPGDMIPEQASFLVLYNPLAYVTEEIRAVTVYGHWPTLLPWLRHTCMGIVVWGLGMTVFDVARSRFADVL